MGKVKAWLMDMEEDAMWMSRDSWAARHGAHNLTVYDEARDKYEGHITEPDGSPEEEENAKKNHNSKYEGP